MPLQSSAGSPAPPLSNNASLIEDDPALRTRRAFGIFFSLNASSQASIACVRGRSIRTGPAAGIGHVLAVLANILAVLDQAVEAMLLDGGRGRRKSRHAVDDFDRQMETVKLVEHDHVERCRR